MRRLALLIPAVAVLGLVACQPREETADTPAAESADDTAVDADTAALDGAQGAAAAESATSEGVARTPSDPAVPSGPGMAPSAQDSTSRPIAPGAPPPINDRDPPAPQSLPRPDTPMPDTDPDGRPSI